MRVHKFKAAHFPLPKSCRCCTLPVLRVKKLAKTVRKQQRPKNLYERAEVVKSAKTCKEQQKLKNLILKVFLSLKEIEMVFLIEMEI